MFVIFVPIVAEGRGRIASVPTANSFEGEKPVPLGARLKLSLTNRALSRLQLDVVSLDDGLD